MAVVEVFHNAEAVVVTEGRCRDLLHARVVKRVPSKPKRQFTSAHHMCGSTADFTRACAVQDQGGAESLLELGDTGDSIGGTLCKCTQACGVKNISLRDPLAAIVVCFAKMVILSGSSAVCRAETSEPSCSDIMKRQ